MALFIEALAHILHAQMQLALCGGGGSGGGGGGGVYIAQTLYLHLGWLLLATCTGGLVPSSTCTYTACTDCNLHCDGGAWWW